MNNVCKSKVITYFYIAKLFLTNKSNKTMATAILVPIYKINSNQNYTSMKTMLFPSAGLVAQPVAAPNNVVNGNILYSQIVTSATGGTTFYSNLTITQVQTLMNA